MHRKRNSGDVSACELASLRPEQYFCATEAFGADSENASGDEHKSTRTNESDSADLGVSAHRRALPHAPRAMKSRARSQSVRCLRRAHYSSSLARTRSRVMMKRLLVEETMSISDITPGPLPNTPAERRRERTPRVTFVRSARHRLSGYDLSGSSGLSGLVSSPIQHIL